MENKTVMVGDIGGTNARFALAEIDNNQNVDILEICISPVRNFQSFYDAVNNALSQFTQIPQKAVFALAGAISNNNQEFKLTNYDLTVSVDHLISKFGFSEVKIVNDFAALARGVYNIIETHPDNDDSLSLIKAGVVAKDAPIVVLGPGTGLGMAIVNRDSENVKITPTEGGHQAFSPRSNLERAILELLSHEIDNVTFEHLLSGDGLVRIYNCLCFLRGSDPRFGTPAEIGQAANQGEEFAAKTAECFALMLATFCSNAVLANGAKGGCVIAGGVAGHLAKFIKSEDFLNRFQEIGIMSDYLKDVMIWHNKDALIALKGAGLLQ